jgi:glycosyltransferase involved in cell wall biosynthesis
MVTGYLRHFHNRTDRTFVATAALADELHREGYARLDVVSRGVDAQRFHPQARSDALRASWGAAEPSMPVLLAVGRVAAEKNIGWAFDAWQAVRDAGLPARLVVVGDGPRRAALARAWPQAVFTGPLRDDALAAAYASADVFLFPSTTETFGNVTLEAMAAGLLVVAFDQAAAGALIRDGHNGCLVPSPATAEAFAARTVAAVAGLPAAGAVRAAARATAERLDWQSVLQRFERALIDRAAARGADDHVAAYLAQQP